MKDDRNILVLSCAIVVASIIIAIGMTQAARIIAERIEIKNNDSSVKIIYELTKALTQKDSGQMIEVPMKTKISEVMGSKSVEGVTVGTNPIKGKVSAPVLIVEFSDFQCPFTRQFYQEVFLRLEKEYISTGKVKFAYRDFIVARHQFARPAAVLARCAAKQGKFWPMFDKLLTGKEWNNEIFKKYTQELNLNINACEKCLVLPEINEAVDKDLEDAAKFGVNSTPTFFINGRFVSGAQPYAVFKRIIDEELAKLADKK